MQGRIIKIISNDSTINSDGVNYVCKPRGKFRQKGISPMVGDNVVFNEKEKVITDILPRRNELIRPRIANISQAFIIASVKNPDLDLNLLDKLLVTVEFNSIKPVICFTKLDLLGKQELADMKKYRDYYRGIGYDVYYNSEIDEIKKCFKNNVTVFTGQSGSGKSTLLNLLDSDLNLKTNEISLALNRGKHTTRHVELIPMLKGDIADTPGFSSLDFHDMENSDIRDNFIEFNSYRDKCKYKDCMHDKDDNCEIKKMVNEGIILDSRYQNYLKFIHRGNK